MSGFFFGGGGGAKMVTFCITNIGKRKLFLKHHPPPLPSPNLSIYACVLIFNIMRERLDGTRGKKYLTAINVASG